MHNVVSANHLIQPYSYRMLYVTVKGDTLGRMLFRVGAMGVLYMPIDWTVRDYKDSWTIFTSKCVPYTIH